MGNAGKPRVVRKTAERHAEERREKTPNQDTQSFPSHRKNQVSSRVGRAEGSELGSERVSHCEGVWVSGLCIRGEEEPPTLPLGGMWLLDLGAVECNAIVK